MKFGGKVDASGEEEVCGYEHGSSSSTHVRQASPGAIGSHYSEEYEKSIEGYQRSMQSYFLMSAVAAFTGCWSSWRSDLHE